MAVLARSASSPRASSPEQDTLGRLTLLRMMCSSQSLCSLEPPLAATVRRHTACNVAVAFSTATDSSRGCAVAHARIRAENKSPVPVKLKSSRSTTRRKRFVAPSMTELPRMWMWPASAAWRDRTR